MKNNNCDLELRLRPSFADDSDVLVSSADGSSVHQQHAEITVFPSERPEQQQIAIFYDGKLAVSEVTELQARAIIMLASGDGAGGQRTRTSSLESSKLVCSNNNKLSSTGLSMKRSLQRFFQKRRQRIQNSAPYSHHKPCDFSHRF